MRCMQVCGVRTLGFVCDYGNGEWRVRIMCMCVHTWTEIRRKERTKEKESKEDTKIALVPPFPFSSSLMIAECHARCKASLAL